MVFSEAPESLLNSAENILMFLLAKQTFELFSFID